MQTSDTQGDGRIVCWSLTDGSVRKEWRMPGPIERMALTADGRYLFTSNTNGTVYVMRVDLPRSEQ